MTRNSSEEGNACKRALLEHRLDWDSGLSLLLGTGMADEGSHVWLESIRFSLHWCSAGGPDPMFSNFLSPHLS